MNKQAIRTELQISECPFFDDLFIGNATENLIGYIRQVLRYQPKLRTDFRAPLLIDALEFAYSVLRALAPPVRQSTVISVLNTLSSLRPYADEVVKVLGNLTEEQDDYLRQTLNEFRNAAKRAKTEIDGALSSTSVDPAMKIVGKTYTYLNDYVLYSGPAPLGGKAFANEINAAMRSTVKVMVYEILLSLKSDLLSYLEQQ